MVLTMGKVKDVQVPDLTNLTVQEAEEKVKEVSKKLKIEVEEEKYHVDIEEGKIISQTPKYQKNFTIKEDAVIKVVVSKGQEIVEMPKLLLLSKDEAVKLLKELGLEAKIEEEYNDEVEKDHVIEQEIPEGEEILAGSVVTIKVSKGIEQVQVPDLMNKSEAEAKQLLADTKLKYKATLKIKDSSKTNGVVVDQSVSAGSYVDKDTEITITINEYNEIKSATLTINVKSLSGYVVQYESDPDPEGNPVVKEPKKVTLRVTVDDEQVESRQVSEASTSETVRIDASGTVEIKVYIDGNRKATKTLNLNTTTTLTID